MIAGRIVADVGGTNVRFARVGANAAIGNYRSWPNASFSSFTEALERYADETGGMSTCRGIGIAAAGPVSDGAVRLTNGTWLISQAEVSRVAHGLPVRVINDLEAVALAIPYLKPDDVAPLGPVGETRAGVKIAVNVGTGFGASIAVPVADRWTAIACEPGHMKLAVDAAHRDLVGSAPSIEDVLSGPGLRALYDKLIGRSGDGEPHEPDSDIFEHASGSDTGRELIGLFATLLGQVSGDLVLATGAWSGVYLCGGIASAWRPYADHAAFRQAFEDKGPMASRMRNVFTGHITSPQAALDGLARLRLE
jgi:glucokinase